MFMLAFAGAELSMPGASREQVEPALSVIAI